MPKQAGYTQLISDATELEYIGRESIADDLGQIGNGFRRGLLAQHVLAVDPQIRKTLGLANQVLYRRKGKKRKVVRKKRTATMHQAGKNYKPCSTEHDSQSNSRNVGKPKLA